MGDLGFFNEAAPDWKNQPEPAVPVTPGTVPPNVTVPAAAPAAPAMSPAQQRSQAVSEALGSFWSPTAPDPAQARILASTPMGVPNQDTGYAVAGVTQSKNVGGTYLSPDAKKAINSATEESRKAADAKLAEGDLIMQNAQELSDQKIAQAAQLQEKAAEDLAKQDAIRKRVDNAMAQEQKHTNDYLKAQKDVDPNRMMKGGRGILAAIAAGLGAYGAILGKSENFAMKIIDNAIQRDWQAQKDAVESKRYRAEASGKLVQELRQTLSDEQSVQLAHNAAVKTAMAEHLDGMATKMKGTEAAANAVTISGQLKAQAEQARAEMLGREQIHASTSTQTQIVPFSKAQAQANALDALVKQSEGERKIADARGLTAQGPDRDEAVKVKGEVAQSLMQLRPLTQFRNELRSSMNAGLDAGVSMDAAKRNQLRRMVADTLGRMRSGGAITEDEVDNFHKMIFGGSLDVTSNAIDELTRRYGNWIMGNAKTRVDMLHPELKDRTWQMIQSGTDENEFRMLRAGKYDDANDKAVKYGGTVRGEPTREDKLKAKLQEQYQGSPSK